MVLESLVILCQYCQVKCLAQVQGVILINATYPRNLSCLYWSSKFWLHWLSRMLELFKRPELLEDYHNLPLKEKQKQKSETSQRSFSAWCFMWQHCLIVRQSEHWEKKSKYRHCKMGRGCFYCKKCNFCLRLSNAQMVVIFLVFHDFLALHL